MREYGLTVLVAAAVTYLLTPLVRRFAIAVGAEHRGRARDVHTEPVPLLGGIAMYLGLAAGLLVASRLTHLGTVFMGSRVASGLLLAGGLVVVMGFVDDRWGLGAITKLAGQVAAGAIVWWSGAVVAWLPWPGGVTLSLTADQQTVLTILVVVVTINAVNFIDGLDGLAAGIVGIGAAAFFLYYYTLTKRLGLDEQTDPALASAILAGVCLGFLPHNFHPARIFMGDTGSMLLGLLLAYAPIASLASLDPKTLTNPSAYSGGTVNRFPEILPLLVPAIIMLIPYADLLLAVVRRTRAGRSPFSADKKHLQHRLLAIGHSHRASVLLMYLWASLFAGTVVLLSIMRTKLLVLGLVTVAGVLVLLLASMPRLRWWNRRSQLRLATNVAGPGPGDGRGPAAWCRPLSRWPSRRRRPSGPRVSVPRVSVPRGPACRVLVPPVSVLRGSVPQGGAVRIAAPASTGSWTRIAGPAWTGGPAWIVAGARIARAAPGRVPVRTAGPAPGGGPGQTVAWMQSRGSGLERGSVSDPGLAARPQGRGDARYGEARPGNSRPGNSRPGHPAGTGRAGLRRLPRRHGTRGRPGPGGTPGRRGQGGTPGPRSRPGTRGLPGRPAGLGHAARGPGAARRSGPGCGPGLARPGTGRRKRRGRRGRPRESVKPGGPPSLVLLPRRARYPLGRRGPERCFLSQWPLRRLSPGRGTPGRGTPGRGTPGRGTPERRRRMVLGPGTLEWRMALGRRASGPGPLERPRRVAFGSGPLEWRMALGPGRPGGDEPVVPGPRGSRSSLTRAVLTLAILIPVVLIPVVLTLADLIQGALD